MSETYVEAQRPTERLALKAFVAMVYSVAGTLFLFNTFPLLAGQAMALLAMTIQLTALVSVYRRAEWAWKVVLAWGALMIVGGAAHWIANVMRPAFIDFMSVNNFRRTATLALGVYFVAYSRKFLSARARDKAASTRAR